MKSTNTTNTGRGISQNTGGCHLDDFVSNSKDPYLKSKPIHLSCPCQKCNPHYAPPISDYERKTKDQGK